MVAMMAYRIVCYGLFLISVDETWLSRCGAWFLSDTAAEITEIVDRGTTESQLQLWLCLVKRSID